MKTKIDVKTVALNRALAILGSLGAQYKIIMPDDGGEYGDLEVAPARKKRPYGDLRNHVRPLIENMQRGDIVEVPAGEFPLHHVQAGSINLATKVWGSGSVITSQRKERGVVEVLRVA